MVMARGAVFMLVGFMGLAGCTSRPALDRTSFRNDGMGVREDSQSVSPVGSVPENQRIRDPALVSAAIRGGDAQVESKEFLAGAELYRRAYDAKPELITLLRLSRALRLGGQAQKAVLTLQHENNRFGNSAPYLVELGRAALAGGYLPEAQAALDKAVTLPDGGWAAWLNMGVLQSRKQQVSQARTSFAEASRRATTGEERDAAAANLGFLAAQEGDIGGGIAILEPLAAKPNSLRRVLSTLAVLKGLQGDRGQYLSYARRSGMSPTEIEEGSRWLDLSNSRTVDAGTEAGVSSRAGRGQMHRSASQRP